MENVRSFDEDIREGMHEDPYSSEIEGFASLDFVSSAGERVPGWLQGFRQKFGDKDPFEEGLHHSTDSRVDGDNAKSEHEGQGEIRGPISNGPGHPGRGNDLFGGRMYGRHPDIPSLSNLQDGRQAHDFVYRITEMRGRPPREITTGYRLPVHGGKNENSEVVTDQPWDVLGISKDANAETIVKAVRKLRILNHPDRVSSQGQEAVERKTKKFKQIGQAGEEMISIINQYKQTESRILAELETLILEMRGPPKRFIDALDALEAEMGVTLRPGGEEREVFDRSLTKYIEDAREAFKAEFGAREANSHYLKDQVPEVCPAFPMTPRISRPLNFIGRMGDAPRPNPQHPFDRKPFEAHGDLLQRAYAQHPFERKLNRDDFAMPKSGFIHPYDREFDGRQNITRFDGEDEHGNGKRETESFETQEEAYERGFRDGVTYAAEKEQIRRCELGQDRREVRHHEHDGGRGTPGQSEQIPSNDDLFAEWYKKQLGRGVPPSKILEEYMRNRRGPGRT